MPKINLSKRSVIDVSALYGALVTNPSGQDFYCCAVGLDVINSSVVIYLQTESGTTIGVLWDQIADWEIELRPKYYAPEP
jgi:hypothetical protein